MTNYQIIKAKAEKDTLAQNAKRAELAEKMAKPENDILEWILLVVLAFACLIIN